jgi:hypothetical protein
VDKIRGNGLIWCSVLGNGIRMAESKEDSDASDCKIGFL